MEGIDMNDKIKARLKKLKKHVPAILSTVGLIAVSAYAYSEHLKVVEYETVDPDAWPTIEVSPGVFKDFLAGHELRARFFKTTDGMSVVQNTTLDEWPEDASEEYDKRVV